MISDGIFPEFGGGNDALDQYQCDLVKNQTAVLIIELGAPTLLRTQQTVRTTFADQIANLGESLREYKC